MYKTIKFTTDYNGVRDITGDVEDFVKESGLENGFVIIHDPHTTGSIGIGSSDDGFGEDFMLEMDKMVPITNSFHQPDTPFAAAGHIKTAIVGTNLSVIVKDGELVLGDGKAILFYEFDGPRMRKVFLKAVKGVK
ncbi:MAG: secondary thiamine-phosphate synthase enzyme YjbQ [Oscillospiraceae bacterium]|jgi:secondary thiamine-phosphate synthase enzyme